MMEQQDRMEQLEVIFDILQKRANNHQYNDVSDLAKECYKMGASYTMLSTLDSYCLKHDLYVDNDWK